MKPILLPLLLICLTAGRSQTIIQDLTIDVKQNGLFLTLQSNDAIKYNNITGWVNEDWFYVTIHKAISDTISILSTPFSSPILKVQNSNSPGSTQLSFRLKNPIDHYEFYLSNNNRTIEIVLYYPPQTVLAMLDKPEHNHYQENLTLHHRLINVSYFTGAALSISGILSKDGSSFGNSELSLGLIILIITYVFDQSLEQSN
ncbi:MAG: hypothetical protein ACE5D0_00750 [Fidelibacterota bacterium]